MKPQAIRNGPSDSINETFHTLYDAARDGAAAEAPVLVVSVDAVTLCRGARESAFPISHGEFHAIKAAAHAPIAVYAALYECSERPLTPSSGGSLGALREAARSRLDELGARSDGVANDVRDILQRTLSFIERALAAWGQGGRDSLDTFCCECGAGLERLTAHGTRAQLVSLDGAANAALGTLSSDERSAVQVVVTGDHQARTRSLAMQYFQKRFGEKPGEEVRVAYGERVTSTGEARALVGTRKLDRAVAAAFFGDAKRLQQDVLGDAAAALLEETEVAQVDAARDE